MKKNKQQKYLVLTEEGLEDLIKVAKNNRHGCAILRLEAAGKIAPGQLSYTDDFRKSVIAIASGFDTWGEYVRASAEEVNRRKKEIEGAELEKEIVNRGPAWR